jgi:hypothetical protein
VCPGSFSGSVALRHCSTIAFWFLLPNSWWLVGPSRIYVVGLLELGICKVVSLFSF